MDHDKFEMRDEGRFNDRRLTAWEDVKLLSGDIIERRNIRLEVLSQDLFGNMGHPVRQLVVECQRSVVENV